MFNLEKIMFVVQAINFHFLIEQLTRWLKTRVRDLEFAHVICELNAVLPNTGIVVVAVVIVVTALLPLVTISRGIL